MQLIKSYWVDWGDEAFPQIRHMSQPGYSGEELHTIKQAKREVVRKAREERQHWLAVINRVQTMTEEKVRRDG